MRACKIGISNKCIAVLESDQTSDHGNTADLDAHCSPLNVIIIQKYLSSFITVKAHCSMTHKKPQKNHLVSSSPPLDRGCNVLNLKKNSHFVKRQSSSSKFAVVYLITSNLVHAFGLQTPITAKCSVRGC